MASTFLFFAGAFNAFLYDFYLFLIIVLISTALLICVENTFWNINDDDNFVKVFKKCFTLYVKSGKMETTERDIEILKNEQGEIFTRDSSPWDSDYAKFYKFIVDHYLRKFHYIYFLLTHLITGTVFTY